MNASQETVAATGMAHFAQTLYRFPGGELYTNFQTACDVCIAHARWPGRGFWSPDNGTTWKEIEPIENGDQHWVNCAPGTNGKNSLTCFAYPMAVADPSDNRTGHLLTTLFEADAVHGVRQVKVANATIKWPAPGLIAFPDSVAPGNWFMVQDGNPIESNTKGEWLLPMYGEWMQWELPLNTTHHNEQGATAAIALVKNTDATMLNWEFRSWVNSGKPWGNPGGGCLPSRGTYWPATDNHDVCNPTETALVRLANGNLLTVWRDDPGYNTTLMAQVSKDDGHTWTTAAPLHGKISNGNYEMIVDAPFGVEPKLAMMDSGVLLLLTGRPRMYLWALPAGADPLTATWQPHDLGKLHNTAVAESSSTLPVFPADFWTMWRGASDPTLRSTGCCTDAYVHCVA